LGDSSELTRNESTDPVDPVMDNREEEKLAESDEPAVLTRNESTDPVMDNGEEDKPVELTRNESTDPETQCNGQ
jgi:hypothetical protein